MYHNQKKLSFFMLALKLLLLMSGTVLVQTVMKNSWKSTGRSALCLLGWCSIQKSPQNIIHTCTFWLLCCVFQNFVLYAQPLFQNKMEKMPVPVYNSLLCSQVTAMNRVMNICMIFPQNSSGAVQINLEIKFCQVCNS